MHATATLNTFYNRKKNNENCIHLANVPASLIVIRSKRRKETDAGKIFKNGNVLLKAEKKQAFIGQTTKPASTWKHTQTHNKNKTTKKKILQRSICIIYANKLKLKGTAKLSIKGLTQTLKSIPKLSYSRCDGKSATDLTIVPEGNPSTKQ